MTRLTHYWTAGLLGFSGLALSVLVPGGPIETRSFAHIEPLTLGLFNTFLTTLAMGSLLLVYFILKAERWAIALAAFCGLAYLGVYGLDLAYIFPVSPDAMPSALWAIEVVGMVVAVPLIGLAFRALRELDKTSSTVAQSPILKTAIATFSSTQLVITISLMGMGLGIIAFATRSAMGL